MGFLSRCEIVETRPALAPPFQGLRYAGVVRMLQCWQAENRCRCCQRLQGLMQVKRRSAMLLGKFFTAGRAYQRRV